MADLDTYVLKMAKRVARLEVRADELSTYIDETQTSVDEARDDLTERLAEVRDEITALRDELDELHHVTTNLIQRFKRVVREDELEQLNDRIDAWRPEDCVTYDTFKQKLDDVT